MLTRNEAIDRMNEWGARTVPFLFFTDFEGKKAWVEKLEYINHQKVKYAFDNKSNVSPLSSIQAIRLKKQPIPKSHFAQVFKRIIKEINYGNSFLTNLTFESPIFGPPSLEDIFWNSRAKYRLWFDEQFVCFSPEIFVRIENDQIHSFPMKGTIDASIPHARHIIINDQKETAEHVTIVDLIRNDLSIIATNVRVKRFRYTDVIQSTTGRLIQVSSEIVGDLAQNWKTKLGELLFSLLPAGSICGAPKPKTIDIIKKYEPHKRGFYTGVCGLFDGERLDSGVMIRFIENRAGHLYYKSGGGITALSNCDKEYEEYIQKIYIPR